MPNFRVRVRLSLDGPGNESTNVRTTMYNAHCEAADMKRRGKAGSRTGSYQSDNMPGTQLETLLKALAPLASLPNAGQSVAVDHIWFHIERALDDPAEAEEAD